jgi:hypothetical protein
MGQATATATAATAKYSVADIASILRASPHKCDVIDRLIIILDLCDSNNIDLEGVIDQLNPQELRAILSHLRQFESINYLAREMERALRLR